MDSEGASDLFGDDQVILNTRHTGNVELRAGEWGSEHIIPRPGSAFISSAGLPISESDAFGIPAVSNVIRSAAGIVAALPFFVYREGEVREPARNSWQWKLLHDQPSPELSSFDFFYDLSLSIEATQNAFIQKAKTNRGQVVELQILDPHRVTVRRDKDSGEKRFDIWVGSGNVIRDLSNADILHIRGFTPNPGAVAGVSLIGIHANVLGAQKAMQQFEGDYFRNSGVPPFWFTGASNSEHAKEIIDGHNAAHAGSGNRFKPGALWGPLDVKSIPISLADAAYAENKQLSIDDVCAIWDWPVWMVKGSDPGQPDPNARMSEFLRTKFLYRLRRIERAFAADPDIFASQPLFGEFLTAALERADFVTRVRGYKDARQGGWLTANEIRTWENLPPAEGGDEILQTPVGGAPNLASPADTTKEPQ